MHLSVQSIIKKVDQIMTQSLKRAHTGQGDADIEEKVIAKILTSVNI
jgi:hypothetical protein